MAPLVKHPLFTALKRLHLGVAALLCVEDFVDFRPPLLVDEGLCCVFLPHKRNFASHLFGLHFKEGLDFGWLHDWPPVVLILSIDHVVSFCRVSKWWHPVSWLKFDLTC